MAGLSLLPHPDFPSVAVTAITVDAGRQRNGQLALRFYVEGNLDDVLWPEFDPPAERMDELWRHSCFEAFIGFDGEPGYVELNFMAPRWAAYRFDTYRAGMRDIGDVETSGSWKPELGEAMMHFTVPELAVPREWRLGLSAIIEAKDGSKSYWALKHPPGNPDFHHADCFAARIAAPAAP